MPPSVPPASSAPQRQPMKVDNNLKEGVVFFCKDCEKLVDVKPVGRKFVYYCMVCGTKNVAFGTEKAVRAFYHVKDGNNDLPAMSEEERMAMKADKL